MGCSDPPRSHHSHSNHHGVLQGRDVPRGQRHLRPLPRRGDADRPDSSGAPGDRHRGKRDGLLYKPSLSAVDLQRHHVAVVLVGERAAGQPDHHDGLVLGPEQLQARNSRRSRVQSGERDYRGPVRASHAHHRLRDQELIARRFLDSPGIALAFLSENRAGSGGRGRGRTSGGKGGGGDGGGGTSSGCGGSYETGGSVCNSYKSACTSACRAQGKGAVSSCTYDSTGCVTAFSCGCITESTPPVILSPTP